MVDASEGKSHRDRQIKVVGREASLALVQGGSMELGERDSRRNFTVGVPAAVQQSALVDQDEWANILGTNLSFPAWPPPLAQRL